MANNWIQKATNKMKKKGTVGSFTRYCGGKVTQACIDRARKSGDKKLIAKATFAANVNKQYAQNSAVRDASRQEYNDLLQMQMQMNQMQEDYDQQSLDQATPEIGAGEVIETAKMFGNVSGGAAGAGAAAGGAGSVGGAAAGGAAGAGGAAAAGGFGATIGTAMPWLLAANFAGMGIETLNNRNPEDLETYDTTDTLADLLQLKFGQAFGKGKEQAHELKKANRQKDINKINTGQDAMKAYQKATNVGPGGAGTGTAYKTNINDFRFTAQSGMAKDTSFLLGKGAPGAAMSLPGGKAVNKGGYLKYLGNSHEQGGILTKAQGGEKIEVEGGEVEAPVLTKNNNGKVNQSNFIFSSYPGYKVDPNTGKLNSNGITPAEMIEKGFDPQYTAKINEELARTVPTPYGGPADPSRGADNIARKGGIKKAQESVTSTSGVFAPNIFVPDSFIPTNENVEENKTSNTQSSVGSQSTAPKRPVETGFTEDPLLGNDTRSGGERFRFQGTGKYIDYGGSINNPSYGNIYKTQWGKKYGITEDMSQEDIKKVYNEQYLPEIERFYENKDQAVSDLKAFYESGHPNADNFRRALKGLNFEDPADQNKIIRIAKKYSTDGKIGSFHMFGIKGDPTNTDETKAGTSDEVETAGEKTIAETKTEKEGGTKEEKELAKGLGYKGEPAIPPLAAVSMAANIIPLFAPKIPPAEIPQATPGVKAPKLPRVNLKQQEASNAADFTANIRSLENLGPAGAALYNNAMLQKQRGDQSIAAQQLQANKSLAGEESVLGMRASQINKTVEAQRRQTAAMIKNQRDIEINDDKKQRLDLVRTGIQSSVADALAYQSELNLAQALDPYDTRGYDRTLKSYQRKRDKAIRKNDTKSEFYGLSDDELRRSAGAEINTRTGYNPNALSYEELMQVLGSVNDTKRSGGIKKRYTSKINKVKRKK